jgi:hypothetical protein
MHLQACNGVRVLTGVLAQAARLIQSNESKVYSPA